MGLGTNMKALSRGKRKPSAVLRLQRTPFDSVADRNLRDVKTCGWGIEERVRGWLHVLAGRKTRHVGA